MKKVLFLVMLLTLLLCIPHDYAEASKGEGPPPGTQLAGPAIVGTLILDGTNATFAGRCKGTEVNVSGYYPTDLSTITKENMENFTLTAVGPAGCHSDDGGEDIIIQAVTKFSATSQSIVADVVILFLVPK